MQEIRTQLTGRSPATGVQRNQGRLDALQQRLKSAGPARLWRLRSRLQLAARALDSVSPLATLDRGYAIVTHATTGRILTDAANVDEGDGIHAQLASGSLEATVTKKEDA